MAWQDFPAFTSSNIASIRYEEDLSILEVLFLNGSSYQYFDVPIYVAEEFKAAGSMGKFLAERIKGHYRYSKV